MTLEKVKHLVPLTMGLKVSNLNPEPNVCYGLLCCLSISPRVLEIIHLRFLSMCLKLWGQRRGKGEMLREISTLKTFPYFGNLGDIVCVFSVTQLYLTVFNPCSPPGSSVHGIFQAILLEWVAISFSRRSSQPRDQTLVLNLLHWPADSLPLCHLGSPMSDITPNVTQILVNTYPGKIHFQVSSLGLAFSERSWYF